MNDIEHGSANYGLQANTTPVPVFLNKVLLEHSHACLYILSVAAFTFFFSVKICFSPTELNSFNRDHITHKAMTSF